MNVFKIIAAFLFLGFFSCRDNTYEKIRKVIDEIKIIDTHEHMRAQKEFHFYGHFSYFTADLQVAGAPYDIGDEIIKKNGNLDSLWALYGKYIEYGRSTTYYAQWLKGLQICYNFNKPYISKEDIPLLQQKAVEKYKDYNKWFDEVFHKQNFEIMFLDQYWSQYNVNIDTTHFALIFRMDSTIRGICDAAKDGKISAPSILKLLNKEAIDIKTIDDYLSVADSIISIFIQHHAVAFKCGLAYKRSLDFEDISYETAKVLFEKKTLTSSEKKQLEDFMFHWLVQKSIVYKIPVEIHTGYLAGTNSKLDDSQPLKLLPVLQKYHDARFDLFHCGYPWMNDFIAIGKNFTNVTTNIVWMPQISRTAAIRTLHELLDCIPYNKICWGGDVSEIESAVGSLELGKEAVATVLAERVDKGWMTEEVAFEIARRIFRENAIEIYHLNKK